MKSALAKLLSGIAVLGIAASACGLTIVPTFDSADTNDFPGSSPISQLPNAAQVEAAINAAIQVLESNITDNVTVNIQFVNNPSGLGASSTWVGSYAYSDFLGALKSHAAGVNDTNALSKLPNSSTDPVIGGSYINLTLPQAVVLGLDSGFGPDGFDSAVGLNLGIMNVTRPPGNPNKYDLQETAAHEMDEVLGISSSLPDTSEISPADLFRYTTNLARTFTTSGDNAYFSVDGTNLLARYNTDPSGDYGDWWSSTGVNWAPPGNTPHGQVQDAYAAPGVYNNLGSNELAILDVVGWTLATTPQTAPKLYIVRSGANQFTLSWTNTASGFVLQERTNLITGSWTFSSTGSTNPAVIVSAAPLKFYRLYKPASSSQQPAKTTAAVRPSTNTALQRHIHVTRPRQP